NIMRGNLALDNDPDGPKLTGQTERISGITDGTSNTILVGEKCLDPRAYDTGGWLWGEPFFAGGGGGGGPRGGRTGLRDAPLVNFANNWGSAHPSGAQFLFADTSVRLLSYATSRPIIQALVTTRGGEVIPLE